MSRPTAAPHHWPYNHRSVEQVDKEHAANRERYRLTRKPSNRRAAQFGKETGE